MDIELEAVHSQSPGDGTPLSVIEPIPGIEEHIDCTGIRSGPVVANRLPGAGYYPAIGGQRVRFTGKSEGLALSKVVPQFAFYEALLLDQGARRHAPHV